jgi:hypothetical protein
LTNGRGYGCDGFLRKARLAALLAPWGCGWPWPGAMRPAGVGTLVSDGFPTTLISEMTISESPCREIRQIRQAAGWVLQERTISDMRTGGAGAANRSLLKDKDSLDDKGLHYPQFAHSPIGSRLVTTGHFFDGYEDSTVVCQMRPWPGDDSAWGDASVV